MIQIFQNLLTKTDDTASSSTAGFITAILTAPGKEHTHTALTMYQALFQAL